MSRQDLADLLNEHLARHGPRRPALDSSYIGKLERGEHRWPQQPYREAFRAVLGARSDADLGFFVIRGEAQSATPSASANGTRVPTMTERRARTLWLAPLIVTQASPVSASGVVVANSPHDGELRPGEPERPPGSFPLTPSSTVNAATN
ncbi:hypothetical protein [Allorhizocola rhizosphaerae]|uniref:hypothetical protein n=1 Tax=Allorhizocola rhizosphaerae TaxID=1872709 RepID=UPI000E3C2D07